MVNECVHVACFWQGDIPVFKGSADINVGTLSNHVADCTSLKPGYLLVTTMLYGMVESIAGFRFVVLACS